MCMNERRFCHCGRDSAYLLFRDNLLPPAILLNLYCPACSHEARRDDRFMLADCGWVLEFDIKRAQVFFDHRGLRATATPSYIFDEGYLTWQGFAPSDQEVNSRLHQRLAHLAEQNLALYLKSLKTEWLAHVNLLKAAGWRKAQAA